MPQSGRQILHLRVYARLLDVILRGRSSTAETGMYRRERGWGHRIRFVGRAGADKNGQFTSVAPTGGMVEWDLKLAGFDRAAVSRHIRRPLRDETARKDGGCL